jgi:uncharacterized protein YcfJ
MNRKLIPLAGALALAASGVWAGAPYEDYARVRSAMPEYEKVNVPRKECYSEYVPERRYRGSGAESYVGPLIGGVTGGLLGAQVGRGNGKVAASAAGAAIGAIVGDRLSNRSGGDEFYEREVRRCRMVDSFETRITGYRVTYEYAGRTYSSMLPYDPGPRLPVRVSVEPADDGARHGPDDERDR